MNIADLPSIATDSVDDHAKPISTLRSGTFDGSKDPRRAGARILDTAEGVLVALRGYSLDQAFVEIVRTAKSRNVSTLSLAAALLATAQSQQYRGFSDVDDIALAAARDAWEHLFNRIMPGRTVRLESERFEDAGVSDTSKNIRSEEQ